MPAYIVVEVEVEDPIRYEDYKKMVPPSLAAYGGRFLVRGAVDTESQTSLRRRKIQSRGRFQKRPAQIR